MNLLYKHAEVAYMWSVDSCIYVKKKNNGLYSVFGKELIPMVNEINEEIDSFRFFNGWLIYKLINKRSTLFAIEGSCKNIVLFDEEKVFNISNGPLIHSKLPIIYYGKSDFMPLGMLLIDSELNIEQKEIRNIYSIRVDDFYFNKSNKSVFSYGGDHVMNYEVDIGNYGRNIKKHRDTGEILSDEPNEIDGELFSYQKLVYVPLKGGQLLALNASDGKKVWMWEHDRAGAYDMAGGSIYKQDGKEIFKIDAASGNLIKSAKFSEVDALDGFHASGPIWAYEDIIVVVDVLSGKICLLNRFNLEVIDFFTIKQKLPFNKDAIAWHDNKLYALDLENTLHILERE